MSWTVSLGQQLHILVANSMPQLCYIHATSGVVAEGGSSHMHPGLAQEAEKGGMLQLPSPASTGTGERKKRKRRVYAPP